MPTKNKVPTVGRLFFVLLVTALLSIPASAAYPRRSYFLRHQPRRVVYLPAPQQPVAPQPPTQPVQPVRPTPQQDSSFVGWLNATRAVYGLPPVAEDANLAAWAAVNNQQQLARGMGHFVMGAARRQNVGMGPLPQICAAWLASPGHRAALLDPTISFIGLAGAGMYWTFSAN